MLCSDLNWLPTSVFKGITYPKVIFEEDEGQDYGGYYEHGSGILTIVSSDTDASTIAHELAHYIQDIENRVGPGSCWEVQGTYEDSINQYFWSQPTEMEALLFEFKYANNWLNDWWLRKLVLNQ